LLKEDVPPVEVPRRIGVDQRRMRRWKASYCVMEQDIAQRNRNISLKPGKSRQSQKIKSGWFLFSG
jgi:hypothetical protein